MQAIHTGGERCVRHAWSGRFGALLAALAVVCLLAGMLVLGGCSPSAGAAAAADGGGTASEGATQASAEPVERVLFAFDTVITLKCSCSEELVDQLAERCTYFEQCFSRTLEGSDVWNINHAGGARVEVAPETADLIEKSLVYCERSGGLIDITIGAVSSLWDFKAGIKPDDAAIAEALSHVDYRGVHVEGTTVWLDDPQAMIDLGATAKGYIADDLAATLRAGGCTSALINLGGNVYVLGSKPDGGNWNVGIQDPNESGQSLIAKISCSDASVVTSGLYERGFELDGTYYHHILDPKTGYPVETDLVSASVLSKSSLDGDAYATWLFLLGRDDAFELIEATDGLEALLVDDSGAMTQTSGGTFEVL